MNRIVAQVITIQNLKSSREYRWVLRRNLLTRPAFERRLVSVAQVCLPQSPIRARDRRTNNREPICCQSPQSFSNPLPTDLLPALGQAVALTQREPGDTLQRR